jgi:methionine-rich copper-binding protein CopC
VTAGEQPDAGPAVRRRVRAGRLGAGTLAALTLVGGAVLGLAAPASAHNYVIAATPASNSTLTELPKTFAITTNDRLLDIGGTDSGFAFRIVGPDGRYFENGCVDVEGPTMSTAAALGKSGKYQAEWQIISADGHTVSDSYDFTWKAPAGFTPATGTTQPPTCATAGNGSTAAASTTGTESGDSASTTSDALWIGAGGLVVVAAVVAVLLLVRRRPAPAADDADEEV